MTRLTLDDLSREELLAWVKQVGFFRVRQADLLSVRHSSLSDKYVAASKKWTNAVAAEGSALMAWHACQGDAREKNRLDRIYLDLKDAVATANRAMKRADREMSRCWEALEAAWAEERI